jgi:hypothetical protein
MGYDKIHTLLSVELRSFDPDSSACWIFFGRD